MGGPSHTLRIDGLVKRYGEVVALNDLSLRVRLNVAGMPRAAEGSAPGCV